MRVCVGCGRRLGRERTKLPATTKKASKRKQTKRKEDSSQAAVEAEEEGTKEEANECANSQHWRREGEASKRACGQWGSKMENKPWGLHFFFFFFNGTGLAKETRLLGHSRIIKLD